MLAQNSRMTSAEQKEGRRLGRAVKRPFVNAVLYCTHDIFHFWCEQHTCQYMFYILLRFPLWSSNKTKKVTKTNYFTKSYNSTKQNRRFSAPLFDQGTSMVDHLDFFIQIFFILSFQCTVVTNKTEEKTSSGAVITILGSIAL